MGSCAGSKRIRISTVSGNSAYLNLLLEVAKEKTLDRGKEEKKEPSAKTDLKYTSAIVDEYKQVNMAQSLIE